MKLSKYNFRFLTRAHVVVGLFAVFLFYIATFFGSITMFAPYIKIWESPSRHFDISDKNNSGIDLDAVLKNVIAANNLPTKNIEITFPSYRDNALKVSVENQAVIYVNPNNGSILHTSDESYTVSSFLNELHTGANIPMVGMPLMGLASTAMIFLSIGGVMLFLSARRKAAEKKDRLWWHKYLGLWLLPYIVVFTFTGAFLGLMLSSSSPFALGATNFEESNMRKLVAPIIFKKKMEPKESNSTHDALSIADLKQKASIQYPNLHITTVNLYAYNKDNYEAMFSGYLGDNQSISGRNNRMSITLNGINGDVVKKVHIEDSHIIKRALSAFYFLHFLPDQGAEWRIAFFVFGIVMAICLIAGYLVWSDRKLRSDGIFHHILNKIAIAFFIGVLPATAVLFASNWILRFDMYDRDIWIKGAFYATWAFVLFYAFLEASILNAIRKYLLWFAVLMSSAVLMHAAKNGYFLSGVNIANMSDTVFFVDAGMLLSSLLAMLAYVFIGRFKYIKQYEQRSLEAW
ncbi:MAG: PepSY-associated TM helix domain-containing protein [Campylobacterales bacterium]